MKSNKVFVQQWMQPAIKKLCCDSGRCDFDTKVRRFLSEQHRLVLHVIVGLDLGGAELMLHRLIDGNRRNDGFRHAVVSLTSVGIVGSRLRSEGVPVFALGSRGPLHAIASLGRLVRIIRKMRPDIVQTWMYHADILGGVSARLAGHGRVIWGVRTTHVEFEGTRLTVILRRACALLSHLVPDRIVCAAEISLKVHAALGYSSRRMLVIPNGFDVLALNRAAGEGALKLRREALGLPVEAIVIGTVGRFNSVKDFRNFIRSAALVRRRCPETHFLMVGRGLDGDNEELAEWIECEALGPHVTLLGERGDVPACLASLDVFCISSRSEGFPNVVGEAMALGVPCVVTDVGDAAVLVGSTGIVVEKENPVALAEALIRVVGMTDDLRRAMGAAARERIALNYSLDTAGSRFAEVYRSVLNEDQGTD